MISKDASPRIPPPSTTSIRLRVTANHQPSWTDRELTYFRKPALYREGPEDMSVKNGSFNSRM